MDSSLTTQHFSAIVDAPFGRVGIRTDQASLCEVVYLPASFSPKPASSRIAEQAAAQIARYLRDPDYVFSLPLQTVGTGFQRRVWEAIAAIPRGQVLTYGAVAKMLRSAPRAVGQACGANWYPMVIPCHRVTAAGGLGGFANQGDSTGFHAQVKRWLLAHEGVTQFQLPA